MAFPLAALASFGSKAATVASTAASVAGKARSTVGRVGKAMGRRKKARRDRIQQRMFGGGGDQQQKGGAIVVAQSRAITPFNLPPKSQESVGPAPTGGGILGILDAIRGTLSQILEVEKQQRDNLQQSILNAAKDKEQAQRTAEQQKQEAKKPTRKRDRIGGAIKNLAAGPLEWLMDFVKLGILNWISDPRNKEAVHNIVKFFQGMVKFIKWTWKWIVQPLWKTISIIGEPILKAFGSFFTLLGNLFTGKIFTDPKEFFRSLLDFPVKLINVIPDIVGGFIRWIGGALWNAAAGIVGGIIDAIRNLFGGIFGGGKDKSGGSPAGELGASSDVGQMVNVSDGKDGKDGAAGETGKGGKDGVTGGVGKDGSDAISSAQPQKLKGETLSSTSNTDSRKQSAAQPTEKFLGDKKDKTSTAAKDEDKPQGFMRGLAGVGDFMTGGVFDLDKRGDSKLQRVQKGMMDFASGGLLDLDGKGGKTWGTARLLAGAADKLTGDRWDFDRHGKGTVLEDMQRQRRDLDQVESSQETYAFGQDSNSAVQEVSSTSMVGGTLPRHGQHCTYKTCL